MKLKPIIVNVALCFAIFATLGANTGRGEKSVEIPPDSIVVPHDKPPKLIHEEIPIYPRLPQEGGFGCNITVKSYIGVNGEAAEAKIISCDRPSMGFEESVLKAEYDCRYEPARHKKESVGVWIIYRVKFDPATGIRRGPLHSHKLK